MEADGAHIDVCGLVPPEPLAAILKLYNGASTMALLPMLHDLLEEAMDRALVMAYASG